MKKYRVWLGYFSGRIYFIKMTMEYYYGILIK